MAIITLRPSSDVTLNHSCSSGSSGYAMIGESSADDASTYIYQSVSGTSSATVTSTFNLGGTLPTGSFKIISATLYVRAASSGSGTYSGTYKLSTDSSASSMSLSTSFQTSSTTATAASLIGETYTSSDFPALTITISTNGNKSSSKDSNFQVRVTQAYLELEYEEVIVEEGNQIYIKENGRWVEYSEVYKKINGTWVLQSDLTTVFNTDATYEKGN